MHKVFVFIFGILLFVFSGCKQYKADLKEYLHYWASQAFVLEAGIQTETQTDLDGIQCVSSSADAEITLTVANPKNFTFIMPNAGETRKIVSFSKLGEGINPKADSDYTLTRVGNTRLKLVLKKEFLQKTEWGLTDLSPTITLYAADGRKFEHPYTFNIKANTPPPVINKYVVAKTQSGGKNYYVLCLQVADMDKTVSGGLLHKDLAGIEINGVTYPFSILEGQTGFTKPDNSVFLEVPQVKKLDTADAEALPTGSWILYYNTAVEVLAGSTVQNYTIKLIDKKGLVSPICKASTHPNKPAPIQISCIKGTCSTDVTSENMQTTPHTIIVNQSTGTATLHIACATTGSTVYYTLTETTSGVPSSPISGNNDGTSFDLALPIAAEKTEADYTLTIWAEAAGFERSDIRTLYYKIRAQSTDTALSVLKLKDGSSEYSAGPLADNNSAYICSIPFTGAARNITLTASTADTNAAITAVTINGTAFASFTAGNSVICVNAVPLGNTTPAYTEVKITVTAEAPNISRDYILTVTYLPVLRNLTFYPGTTAGGTSVPFRDADDSNNVIFNARISEYSIFADKTQLHQVSMNFTYTAEPGAVVTVTGNNTASTALLPGTGGTTTVTFTVKKDGLQNTYTVYLKRKSYNVTFKAIGSDGGTGGSISVENYAGTGGISSVNGNNSAAVTVRAEVGAILTAAAAADTYYTFSGWSGDGVSLSTNPEKRTYIVETQTEITANFTIPHKYVRGSGGDWYNGIIGAAAGNDITGNGSKQKPFATVTKALSACTNPAESYTIFADGTIDESATINIENGKTITIQSLREEMPAVINGNRSYLDSGTMYRYLVQTAGRLTLDSVILKSFITDTHGSNSSPWVCGIQQTNGEVIVTGTTKITQFAHAVEIQSGTFTMQSGSICNNYVNGNDSGVEVKGGTFILNGGSITNNQATNGAAVAILSGNFTMTAGTILENKATCYGGGIYVSGGTGDILGGTIKNNHAAKIPYGLNEDVGGGGICVLGGTVHFSNGIIEANYLDGAEKNCGAGVFVKNGDFKMSGGMITGCTTDPSASSPHASKGGGIYISGGSFIMSGGTIKECTATEGKGGYIKNGTFALKNNAYVDSNNDVYLCTGIKIAVTQNKPLVYNPAATITPQNYSTGTVVVQDINGNSLGGNSEKFNVTPENGTIPWYIDSNGQLQHH